MPRMMVRMGALGLVARAELRRRRASLLGLFALTLLVTGAMLSLGAGARRTASSLTRFEDATHAPDVFVQYGGDDPEAFDAALRRLPEVELVGTGVGYAVLPEVGDAERIEGVADFSLFTDPTGVAGDRLQRPRVRDGRLPRATSRDEAALNEAAAAALRLQVGDRFSVLTFAASDWTESGPTGFGGPRVPLRVVGIVRSPSDLQGGSTFAGPAIHVAPTFAATYPGAFTFGGVHLLQLRDGAVIDDFRTRVRQLAGPGVELFVETPEGQYRGSVQRAIGVLTNTMLAALAVVAVAGLAVVTQSGIRQLAQSAVLAPSLAGIGLRRNQAALALGLAALVPVVGGVLLGAVAAALVSGRFPIGIGARAEPDPGLRVDWPVLAAGSVAIVAFIAAVLFVAARRVVRPTPSSQAAARPSAASAAAASLGLGPVPVAGLRFAFEAGAARRRVPVRSAVLGSALGIAGIIGIAVITESVDGVHDHPDRFGWNWTSMPDFAAEFDPDEEGELRRQVASDSRISSAGLLRGAGIEIERSELRAFSIESVKGSTTLRIRSGRLPTSPTEIAIGAASLRDFGADVGDTVRAVRADGRGSEDLVVVGQAVLPTLDNPDPGRGAALTPEGLERIARSGGEIKMLLTARPGADVPSFEQALARDYPFEFSLYARPSVPGSLRNIRDANSVLVATAAFFAVLALIGLTHALAVASRQRAPEVGVLQALGFVRHQVSWTMRLQAIATVAAGLLIGLPAGVVGGRLTWRLVSSGLGLVDAPAMPLEAVAVVVPVGLAVAALVASVPAWLLSRRPLAAVLRAE